MFNQCHCLCLEEREKSISLVCHALENAKMFWRLARKHKTRVTFNLVIANEIHMHLIKGLMQHLCKLGTTAFQKCRLHVSESIFTDCKPAG
jgi:hypothetical protein